MNLNLTREEESKVYEWANAISSLEAYAMAVGAMVDIDAHDSHGSAMGILFPVCAELHYRGLDIPEELEYRHGIATSHEEGDKWAEELSEMELRHLLYLASRLDRLNRELGTDY